MAGKDGHRENTDFYSGGSSGHPLTTSRSQGNLEESLRGSSYSGFSPSSHNAGFTTYSAGNRENLATSPYFMNNAAQSGFDSYASTSANGDSTFETYTQGTDQPSADFTQFSTSKNKSPSYMRFSDGLSGGSSTGSYPELGTTLNADSSSFRGDYSADPYRSHTQPAASFVDSADQSFNREPANLFNNPSSDYTFSKPKDGVLGMAGSTKFTNDAYSIHPETRYVRGSHGNSMSRDYASSMFLGNSGSSPYSSTRGSPSIYGSGKLSKHNKYMADYTSSGGLNYLSKEQDVDYLFGNYGKGGGKPATIKEARPSSYASQPYLAGPSYLNKIVGSYKSKPTFMSTYPGSSPVAYASMSGLPGSFSGNSYADGPLLRRYRSSSYVPGHGSVYSGYY